MNIETLNIIENEPMVHISIIQRNRRQCITTIEGLDTINKDEKFLDKIVKKFKKEFNCGVSRKKENDIEIFKIQGDRRKDIKDFLIRNELIKEENIKIHGF